VIFARVGVADFPIITNFKNRLQLIYPKQAPGSTPEFDPQFSMVPMFTLRIPEI
jgi:hypothetical protein